MNEQRNVHLITVKVIVFSVIENVLHVYLPGGVLPNSPLLRANTLEQELQSLLEKHNLSSIFGFSEQLYSQNNKQSFQQIDIVYYKLMEQHLIPSQSVLHWRPVDHLDTKSGDVETLEYALQRLQWKIEYTNIVYSLLPLEFTLSELQSVYEAILRKQLDKRNFRKKILSLSMLMDTNKKKILGRARPATMYTFKDRHLSFVQVL